MSRQEAWHRWLDKHGIEHSLERLDEDEANEETDDEFKRRILDHYMPIGSQARAEHELRDALHAWGKCCLPAGVMLGIKVNIGQSAAPFEMMLIVRTEWKVERLWRLAWTWIAERRRRWRQ